MLGCKNKKNWTTYSFSQQGICQWLVVLFIVLYIVTNSSLSTLFSFDFVLNAEGGLSRFLQLIILV